MGRPVFAPQTILTPFGSKAMKLEIEIDIICSFHLKIKLQMNKEKLSFFFLIQYLAHKEFYFSVTTGGISPFSIDSEPQFTSPSAHHLGSLVCQLF